MSKHRRPGDRRPGLVLAALAVAGVTLLGASSPALAAKGGGKSGGGGGKPTSSSSSDVRLVLLDSTDGSAHWSQHVTFEITTTATTQPAIQLNCYQGGSEVYASSAGFYPEYPWPQNQTFVLQSTVWTGGAADCVATMYYMSSSGRTVTGGTLNFAVSA